MSFVFAQATVVKGDSVPQSNPEDRFKITGQENFGGHEDRLTTGPHYLFNGSEINLGFAASGDAIKQEGGKIRLVQPLTDLRQGLRLVWVRGMCLRTMCLPYP